MTNALEYFRMVLHIVLPKDVFINNHVMGEYFYSTYNNQTYTQRKEYYFLSNNYLVVAGTGSGHTKDFLNMVKVYRRECMQWKLINGRQMSGVDFSTMKVKLEAVDLLKNYLEEKVSNDEHSYHEIETYVDESMNSVFSNQFENLHKLYLNEA